jgi:hypothetical protein
VEKQQMIYKCFEETLYYGENSFYMKRIVPGRDVNEFREQINLGHGWETLSIINTKG